MCKSTLASLTFLIVLLSTIIVDLAQTESSHEHWLSDSNRNALLKHWLQTRRVNRGSPAFETLSHQFKGTVLNIFLHLSQGIFLLFKDVLIHPNHFNVLKVKNVLLFNLYAMEIPVIVQEIQMKMKKHVLQVIRIIFSIVNHSILLISAKRPAKENIEKFLTAEYTLHGLKLFNFLFGEKVSKRIDENNIFWFDVLASAFSGNEKCSSIYSYNKIISS